MCLIVVVFFAVQVFDATNTTRERRDLILNFVKENAYKVLNMSRVYHLEYEHFT